MKIEDKIKLIKSDLVELNKELLKSDVEYNTTLQFMNMIKDLDLKQESNYNILKNMLKEARAKELELLRVKVSMVRKFSPETADYLDSLLKQYETMTRNFIGQFDKIQDPSIPTEKKLEMFLQALVETADHHWVQDMVNICRNCVRDTLKRLESTE